MAIVAGDPRVFQHDLLTATPLSLVREDPELTRCLQEAGVDFRLEPLLEGILRPAFQPLPADHTPSSLLRAEHCVVPRQGREQELEAAVAWCLDAKAPPVKLIQGSGGLGKTRFAIELCRELLQNYPIPPERVLAHSDVAPMRKEDPGELFPWRQLHAAGVMLQRWLTMSN